SPLMRTDRVLLPQSMSPMAWITFLRACALSSGATESSRSRLMTSAAEPAIFSNSASREPGPKSWQRFRRAGAAGCVRKDMACLSSKDVSSGAAKLIDNCCDCIKLILHLRKPAHLDARPLSAQDRASRPWDRRNDMTRTVYLNGDYLPEAEAKVSI